MSFSLSQYGIVLKRVTRNEIELIRNYRNLPAIYQTMAYRKKISKAMQIKWFNSVNNNLNYYFLIYYENRPVGVINCKNVDRKNKIGEGGIFTWDVAASENFVPIYSSLILLDFIFYKIKVGNKSAIRIMRDNNKAKAYNSLLGYVPLPSQDFNDYQWYILTEEDYRIKSKKIRDYAIRLSGQPDLIISGHKSELNIEEINQLL